MAKSRKGRKLRVELRKNQQTRARKIDFTREISAGREEAEDLALDERMSGKGALTRKRTIITEDDSARRLLDDPACAPGRLLSAVGSLHCLVQLLSGSVIECSVRRLVRSIAQDARSAVVVGDRVIVRKNPDGTTGVIEWVEPRSSTVTRGHARGAHVIVANIDQVVIVVSALDPPLKPALIDRFLVSAHKGNVTAVIAINKVDLTDPVELQPIAGLYAQLGYHIILTSAATGEGIDELRSLLKDRETVFSGQSGVGKSSLLNALQPGLNRTVSEVAEDSGKGRHTTRSAQLIPLTQGGWVVDTPGIRQLELWDVLPEEVEGFFTEFRPWVAHCRFRNCTHSHEQHCAVKNAVALRLIMPLRYASYLRMIEPDAAPAASEED